MARQLRASKINKRKFRESSSKSRARIHRKTFHKRVPSNVRQEKPCFLVKPFPIDKTKRTSKGNILKSVSTQAEVIRKQQVCINMKGISSPNTFDEPYECYSGYNDHHYY